MPDDRPPLPAHAVERILARATELQAGISSSEAPDGMTEAQLLEVAREVGIAPEHLRRAIAEERARVPVARESGFAARVAGPAAAAASRVITGDGAATIARLDEWMRREECLVVRRRFADGMSWERRSDVAGQIKRAIGGRGRSFVLTRASEVVATVVPVEHGRVAVSLSADLREARSGRVGSGAAVASAGVAGSAVGLSLISVVGIVPPFELLAALGALLPGVAGLAGGWGIAAAHRSRVEAVQVALEQVLDQLEHAGPARGGGQGQSLLDALANAGFLPKR